MIEIITVDEACRKPREYFEAIVDEERHLVFTQDGEAVAELRPLPNDFGTSKPSRGATVLSETE